MPSGPVWCVTRFMPKIGARLVLRVGEALGDLDAAALAAAAGVDLRLDDDDRDAGLLLHPSDCVVGFAEVEDRASLGDRRRRSA